MYLFHSHLPQICHIMHNAIYSCLCDFSSRVFSRKRAAEDWKLTSELGGPKPFSKGSSSEVSNSGSSSHFSLPPPRQSIQVALHQVRHGVFDTHESEMTRTWCTGSFTSIEEQGKLSKSVNQLHGYSQYAVVQQRTQGQKTVCICNSSTSWSTLESMQLATRRLSIQKVSSIPCFQLLRCRFLVGLWGSWNFIRIQLNPDYSAHAPPNYCVRAPLSAASPSTPKFYVQSE